MVPIGELKGHSTPQDVGQDFAPLAKSDGSSSFQVKTFVNAIADMAKAVTTGNIQELELFSKGRKVLSQFMTLLKEELEIGLEAKSPRDIETVPTPVDTSLKADQEQSPLDPNEYKLIMKTAYESKASARLTLRQQPQLLFYQQQQHSYQQMMSQPCYEQNQPSFQQPQSHYQQLHPSYKQPQPCYEHYQPFFQQPQPQYQQLHPSYMQQQPCYEHYQPFFQQWQPLYQQLHPSYMQPQPQYQQQNPSYMQLPPPIHQVPYSLKMFWNDAT